MLPVACWCPVKCHAPQAAQNLGAPGDSVSTLLLITCCLLRAAPTVRRLIYTLREYPNTEDFVYLRRMDRNPSEYDPYALEVRTAPIRHQQVTKDVACDATRPICH